MPSSQVRRCMKILRYLYGHAGSSTTDIYNEILADDEYQSVELRQIQRDLRTLEGEQILDCEQTGREKFWSLRKEWKNVFPETYRGNQLLGLYVLKSYLTQFKGTIIGRDVGELIRKIEGSAGGDVFLLSVEHTVGQMNTSRIPDEMLLKTVRIIQGGTWASVTYFNHAEQKEKTYPVFPCRLFTFNGELYLIGYNPKYKNYNALAVRNIRSLDALEIPPGDEDDVHTFDEERFTRERFGVFADAPVRVRLQIDREEQQFFTNRTWHPTQHFSTMENGDVMLEMNVPLSPELTTWILGWKHYVRVLEPQELVDDVLAYLDKIRGRYD